MKWLVFWCTVVVIAIAAPIGWFFYDHYRWEKRWAENDARVDAYLACANDTLDRLWESDGAAKCDGPKELEARMQELIAKTNGAPE